MSSLIGTIHIAKKQLGMDEDAYRGFLAGVTGKTSCAAMSSRELWRVVEALKKVGFNPASGTKKKKNAPSQMGKIRALWLNAANSGYLRERSEKAIDAYIQRITGRSAKECEPSDLSMVIESLKAWIGRLKRAR